MSSHFGAVVFCLYETDAASRREFLETISETESESRGRRSLPLVIGASDIRVALRDRGVYRIVCALHDNESAATRKKSRILKKKKIWKPHDTPG